MASSLIDELLGLKRPGGSQVHPGGARTPEEAADPSHPTPDGPLHPKVGWDAPTTPPPRPSLDEGLARVSAQIDTLGHGFDAVRALADRFAEFYQRAMDRERDIIETVVIGQQFAAYRLPDHNRPYLRIWVNVPLSVLIEAPGLSATPRTFLAGWNVLDLPPRTRIWQPAGATIAQAIVVCSYWPLDALAQGAASGVVALASGAPAATNVGADTSVPFSVPVAHWTIQNNTAASVGVELDAAASAGSLQIAAGQSLTSEVPVSTLHLFTAAAQNINGTAGSNIVIRGWN